jgi:cytochrome c peroxidase
MGRRCVIAGSLIVIAGSAVFSPRLTATLSSGEETHAKEEGARNKTDAKTDAAKSSPRLRSHHATAKAESTANAKERSSRSASSGDGRGIPTRAERAALAKTRSSKSSSGSASGEASHTNRAGTSAVADSKTVPASPVQPPNVVPLTDAEQLGKNIFFDATLSNPPGKSCATCHGPTTGFTSVSSVLNKDGGPIPGVVPHRVERRKPQSIPYATFSPYGPYYCDDPQVWLGGTFWDGHAPDTAAQARMPFLDPNEMANIPVGPYPPHAGGYGPLVVEKLERRPYASLFLDVYGPAVFDSSVAEIYAMATAAIAAYEASAEINPFSAKYDASSHGTPAMSKYKFSRAEQNGMTLFFGKAQCSACHSAATLDVVLNVTGGKDTFTMYCYANIGVPKNPDNPFYKNTNCSANPEGCNPAGARFVDYGLGANPNPSPGGARFNNGTPGDIAQFRGLFKAPSVRNVAKRPTATFVKDYMHNGVFKSLEEVVHFYNKRNIAVNHLGHEVPFDLRVGPPTGYTRLLPPPEVLDNVQNVSGAPPDDAGQDVSNNGQVGNLGLSANEQSDLIAFLKTLTDGFTVPNPADAE